MQQIVSLAGQPSFSTEKYIWDITNISFPSSLVASTIQYGTFAQNIANWQSVQIRNASNSLVYLSFQYNSNEIYFCTLFPGELRNIRFPVAVNSIVGSLSFAAPLINSSPPHSLIGQIEIYTSSVPVLDSGSYHVDARPYTTVQHWIVALNTFYTPNSVFESGGVQDNYSIHAGGAPSTGTSQFVFGSEWTELWVMSVDASVHLAAFSTSYGISTQEYGSGGFTDEGVNQWPVQPGVPILLGKNVRGFSQTLGTTNTVLAVGTLKATGGVGYGTQIPIINTTRNP